MKYLKTFEDLNRRMLGYSRLYYDSIQKSPILNELYLTIKKAAKCQTIYEVQFYVDSGILWILCRYKAKNRVELIDLQDSGYYNSIMKYIKDMLEKHNPYVEKVFYEFKNRIAPLKMDATSGGLQSANQCIYEIKCYLKKEAVTLILDEIDMYDNADKYNL